MARIAVSGLNQPGARLGNVSGRNRKRAAKWIQRLLDALADGGLFFGFWPLPSDLAQARTKHRRRRHGGGSESEHHHSDGEKDQNGESQNHESDLTPDDPADHEVTECL